MTEKGEVIGTEGKLARVRFIRSTACGNCVACGMSKDAKEVIIAVNNSTNAKIGDWVEIEFNTQKALASSAIAYIFPLAMLVIGVAAGYFLVNGGVIQADKEIVAAGLGIGLTILAFLIIRILDPVLRKKMKHTNKIAESK